MSRRLRGALLALGLMAGAAWLLGPARLPETASERPALSTPTAVSSDRAAEPAANPTAKTTPEAVATATPSLTDSAGASAARGAAKAAARLRLSAAWTCLASPPMDAGVSAEDWTANLPSERQQQAERDYADVSVWAEENCRTLPAELLDDNGQLSLPDLLALASTGPGDPLMHMAQLLRQRKRPLDPATLEGMRAALAITLQSALASPTADELRLIGALVSDYGHAGALGPGSGSGGPYRNMVWALAACDLGDDCGRQSPVLRQLCFQELLCGYPDLESAVLDGVWPQGMTQALQAERRELVRRLRENAGVGLFEPVPASPGRG